MKCTIIRDEKELSIELKYRKIYRIIFMAYNKII